MKNGDALSRTERVWVMRLAKGPRMQRVMGDEAINRLVRRGIVLRGTVRDPRKPKRALGYALALTR